MDMPLPSYSICFFYFNNVWGDPFFGVFDIPMIWGDSFVIVRWSVGIQSIAFSSSKDFKSCVYHEGSIETRQTCDDNDGGSCCFSSALQTQFYNPVW